MADPGAYQRNQPYVLPGQHQFTTPLGEHEPAFREWVRQNRVPFDPDDPASDYDMRGFWLALQQRDPRATSAVNPNDNRLHYPDYWKTPHHQSFSNESQWANPSAPAWNDQDQLVTPDGTVVFDERARAAPPPPFQLPTTRLREM